VKTLTFSPSQAARLLREARIEDLTALISSGDAPDVHFAKKELLNAQKRLEMLEQVPVRGRKSETQRT
jgi:hypothetical protein